jgi:hypothetical protein
MWMNVQQVDVCVVSHAVSMTTPPDSLFMASPLFFYNNCDDHTRTSSITHHSLTHSLTCSHPPAPHCGPSGVGDAAAARRVATLRIHCCHHCRTTASALCTAPPTPSLPHSQGHRWGRVFLASTAIAALGAAEWGLAARVVPEEHRAVHAAEPHDWDRCQGAVCGECRLYILTHSLTHSLTVCTLYTLYTVCKSLVDTGLYTNVFTQYIACMVFLMLCVVYVVWCSVVREREGGWVTYVCLAWAMAGHVQVREWTSSVFIILHRQQFFMCIYNIYIYVCLCMCGSMYMYAIEELMLQYRILI